MRFRRPLDEEPELNLIPLIDVMLIVLIFLAVTTSYARFAELKIELPTADATKANQRPNEILVGVTADGRYAIDRQLLPYADPSVFAQQLTQAVVANARRSPSYGCALRLDWSALGSPLGHAGLPLTL